MFKVFLFIFTPEIKIKQKKKYITYQKHINKFQNAQETFFFFLILLLSDFNKKKLHKEWVIKFLDVQKRNTSRIITKHNLAICICMYIYIELNEIIQK